MKSILRVIFSVGLAMLIMNTIGLFLTYPFDVITGSVFAIISSLIFGILLPTMMFTCTTGLLSGLIYYLKYGGK